MDALFQRMDISDNNNNYNNNYNNNNSTPWSNGGYGPDDLKNGEIGVSTKFRFELSKG